MKVKAVILSLGFLISGHTVYASDDLLSIYNKAKTSDSTWLAAISANRAAQMSLPIARAGLLPNISLGAATSRDFSDSSRSTSSEYFNSHSYSLSLSQPVFRWDRKIQYDQAATQVLQADAEMGAQAQSLITRVASAYFNLLKAEDNLEFAQKTQDAIQKQLDQAKQRFDVGLIAITGVDEAKARYDLSRADKIKAANEVENAREALREISGEYYQTIPSLGDNLQLLSPDPADIEEWTNVALQQNLGITAAKYALSIASDEIKNKSAGHYPTLDLVASKSYSTNGGGAFGSSTVHSNSIGLQLNIPVFSGGATSSATEQARHLYQQASEVLEGKRRSVQKELRAAYRGVVDSIASVEALSQALISTQTALSAIEAGYEVGTRTTVDVLDALKDMFKSKRDYQAGRYDYALNTLLLKQAAGTLNADDLVQINSWLN